MARRVSIPIVGDPTSFVRAVRSSSHAASAFGRELKEVGITAEKSANAQVAAALKTDRRLREEIRAYREVAASAKRGSREQVSAANLAARAEGRLAHSIGVTARESHRHSRLAGAGNRDAGRAARGALAGAGAFRSLGRSVAFASSYFIGGYGLVYGLKHSVDAASDLEEQVAKTNVVFGRNARGIVGWARTTANSFGISQRAALTYAGTFGALLRPSGFGPRRAAGLSRQLVERAADLASFYNTSEQDSLAALQSGLVGQVRPLRRYGVQLSVDRMKAIAFSTGIAKPDVSARAVGEAEERVAIAQVKLAQARKKHGASSVEAAAAALSLKRAEDGLHKSLSGSKAQLTDQQKVLARIAIIMKDSTLARGDFARTSGHLAQQEKILNAQLENQVEQVGRRLTPMVLHYVSHLNKWLSKSENQRRVTRAVKDAVHALGQAVRVAANLVRRFAEAAHRVAHAVGGWKNAFKLILAGVIAVRLARIAIRMHDIYKMARLAAGEGGIASLLTKLRLLAQLGPIAIPIILAYVWRKDISTKNAFGPRPGLRAQHPDMFDAPDGPAGHGTGAGPTGEHASGGGYPSAHRVVRAAHAVAKAVADAEDKIDAQARRRARIRAARARMLAAAEERREASRRQALQMRLLGFGPTGGALTPTKAALKRELGSVSQALKGTFLDTGEHRSLMSKIRRLLSGQLGALSADVRSKIKDLLDDLKGQMNEFDGFNLTKAEKRRRFLDRHLRDIHRDGHSGVTGTGPGGSGKGAKHVHHHTYNIKGSPGETNERMIRRAHWRLRTQMA